MEAAKYDVQVPVGFDAHIDGIPVSTFMVRYGTGGTPWTTVIDKQGVVRFNDFTPADSQQLTALVDELRAAPAAKTSASD